MSVADIFDINATNIRELKLGWNKITARGGNAIADSMRTNRHLRFLDLSWNACGHGANVLPEQVGKTWASAFQENKTLQHVDLSHNKILYQDTVLLAKGLQKNHTIYGFHFEGNDGTVNSLEFLLPRSLRLKFLATIEGPFFFLPGLNPDAM